jgi:hypothetical protein
MRFIVRGIGNGPPTVIVVAIIGTHIHTHLTAVSDTAVVVVVVTSNVINTMTARGPYNGHGSSARYSDNGWTSILLLLLLHLLLLLLLLYMLLLLLLQRLSLLSLLRSSYWYNLSIGQRSKVPIPTLYQIFQSVVASIT